MFTYRNIRYQIEWVNAVAHYTIYVRRSIYRGEGNHGSAKDKIDLILSFY